MKLCTFMLAAISAIGFCAESPEPTRITEFLSDANVSIGMGTVISRDFYKGTDTKGTAIPVITAEFDKFFISGMSFGYHMIKDDSLTLDAVLQYAPEPFETKDSQSLAGIERDGTINGGITASFVRDSYVFSASVLTDLLSEHQGYLADISIAKLCGDKTLSFVPKIGISIHDDNYNRYYYGVRQSEAIIGRDACAPGGGVNPYCSVFANYKLSEKWSLFAAGGIEWAANQIQDSTITSRDYSTNMLVGASYKF